MPEAAQPVQAGLAGLPRVLPPAPVRGLTAHDDTYGPPRFWGPDLIAEVERSGLTGRGGAAFPAGRKLRSVAERAGRRGAVLIANGMESEPGSAKDKCLLGRVPHLVLDGITLAAQAVGATEAYLCLSREDQAGWLESVVAERAGTDPVALTVLAVPDSYVASEESALVNYVNTGRALPMFTPPRPFEKGVRGRPTLVSNVETLANIALIARYGAAWFRSLGTAEAPGTALITVSGAVRRPGVYEIPLGVPLREALAPAVPRSQAGPLDVLAGGFFGCWLPGGTALGLPASAAGMRSAGASFGAGIFLVLPRDGCGLAETARVLRYLAGQSAGQCGPCVNGLPAIADAMEHLAFRGGHGSDAAQQSLQHLMSVVEGRGACRMPDGATRLAASALRAFAGDVRRHAVGPCAGARARPAFRVPA